MYLKIWIFVIKSTKSGSFDLKRPDILQENKKWKIWINFNTEISQKIKKPSIFIKATQKYKIFLYLTNTKCPSMTIYVGHKESFQPNWNSASLKFTIQLRPISRKSKGKSIVVVFCVIGSMCVIFLPSPKNEIKTHKHKHKNNPQQKKNWMENDWNNNWFGYIKIWLTSQKNDYGYIWLVWGVYVKWLAGYQNH